jgi:BASS family bile acid:Na+ symporter
LNEGDFFSEYVLPATLAVIMFGIGISLRLRDFKRIFRYPKKIATGLASQMILLPSLAFLIVGLAPLPAAVKVGFIIISACPGGTASNLVTYLLKGNTPLSISLTASNSVLILITIPLITRLALKLFMGEAEQIDLPVGPTVANILLTTLLPVLVGITLRERFTPVAKRLEKPMRYVLPALLAGVFAFEIFFRDGRREVSIFDSVDIYLVGLLLNFSSMLAAYFIAHRMKLYKPDDYTLSIEVGLQNSALAIYVASSLLGNSTMALVAVVYSSFTFFTTMGFAYAVKRYRR